MWLGYTELVGRAVRTHSRPTGYAVGSVFSLPTGASVLAAGNNVRGDR